MREALYGMFDLKNIRANGGNWKARPQQYLEAHIAQRARIEELLEEPHIGPTVVVTHHAPHPNSLRDGRVSELLDGAYASDLSAIMESSDAPDLGIHGHILEVRDYVVGSTRVIAI